MARLLNSWRAPWVLRAGSVAMPGSPTGRCASSSMYRASRALAGVRRFRWRMASPGRTGGSWMRRRCGVRARRVSSGCTFNVNTNKLLRRIKCSGRMFLPTAALQTKTGPQSSALCSLSKTKVHPREKLSLLNRNNSLRHPIAIHFCARGAIGHIEVDPDASPMQPANERETK